MTMMDISDEAELRSEYDNLKRENKRMRSALENIVDVCEAKDVRWAVEISKSIATGALKDPGG